MIEITDEKVSDLYLNQKLGSPAIAKLFGVKTGVIQHRIKKLGIGRSSKEAGKFSTAGYSNRKYTVDEDYFKDINTANKAYILGFILGDGNICQKGPNCFLFSIGLKGEDKELLEKIKKELNYSGNLRFSNNIGVRKNGSVMTRVFLEITNKPFCKNLINQGITPRKTATAQYIKVPDKYERDFIRGLVDSDGCIDHNMKRIAVLGTLDIVRNIQRVWESINVKAHIYKRRNIYNLSSRRKYELPILAEYLYKDAELFLQRKYDLALQIMDDENYDK